jgi:hypothetical protein
MPPQATTFKPQDLERLYDGQRRIEDKVTEISVAVAKIPDHSPRIAAVEVGLVDTKVSLGQIRMLGTVFVVAAPIVAAIISLVTHFILKGH